MLEKKKNGEEAICTVLLFSYNHENTISKCIESVLKQKTNYKFIIKIFDDASTDSTVSIIRKFEKKYRGKVFGCVAKQNRGAQTNIWEAITSVKTKYFIITETDDYWCDEKKLQLQIDALEMNGNCSFCCTNSMTKVISDKYLSHRDGTKEIADGIFNKPVISFNDIDKLQCGFLTHISTRLVRTSSIDFQKLKNKETVLFDAAQFFYLITKGNMYWIDKICSVYVKTGKGTCSSASSGTRMQAYWRAMVDMNEDTDCVIWRKVAQQLSFVSTVWLRLDKEAQTSTPAPVTVPIPISNIPQLNKDCENGKAETTTYSFLGISVIKILDTKSKHVIYFCGVPIYKIRYYQELNKIYVFGVRVFTSKSLSN